MACHLRRQAAETNSNLGRNLMTILGQTGTIVLAIARQRPMTDRGFGRPWLRRRGRSRPQDADNAGTHL